MAFTLYYSPGACSLAPHIVLLEAGLPFELRKVDLSTHEVASGENYFQVNPKGYVPALQLATGETLTEAGVILQYLADQQTEGQLAPRWGTMERYRLLEVLNFIATEIHKTFAPLFNPRITPEWRSWQTDLLASRFTYVNGILDKQEFFAGPQFSIADAYLYTVLTWADLHKVGLERWPSLEQYKMSLQSRPSIVAAHRAEGTAVE